MVAAAAYEFADTAQYLDTGRCLTALTLSHTACTPLTVWLAAEVAVKDAETCLQRAVLVAQLLLHVPAAALSADRPGQHV